VLNKWMPDNCQRWKLGYVFNHLSLHLLIRLKTAGETLSLVFLTYFYSVLA
jgi:hypothetical protein